MHWYKRDPDAALTGMAELTLQERGAYNSILDLIYSRDGGLKDDDDMIARVLSIHGNEWNAVKRKLIAKGKIWVTPDGKLTAKRVEKTIKEATNFSETQRKRVGKRWEKQKTVSENNDPEIPLPVIPIQPQPQPHIIEGEPQKIKKGKSRKQPEVPLPSDWKPTVNSTEKAQKLGFTLREIAREAEKFKNHARQHDRRAVRWDAAFDNWIINSAEFQNKSPPASTEKTETFPAMPESPEFLAWKAHYQDTGNKHMVHLLNQRTLEGRPWHFQSKWPPGHRSVAA